MRKLMIMSLLNRGVEGQTLTYLWQERFFWFGNESSLFGDQDQLKK